MARDAEHESRPVIIKKYANRRLYNTDTSTYVTLEDLAEMVRGERDFVVYDAKTGEDLTHSVLTQIIVEQESRGTNLLPIGFLRQLIRFYGDSMQKLVPSYLEFSLDSLTRQQEQYRRRFAHTFGTAAFEAMQEQVGLTAPTDGSTVSGTVSVSADASDDTAVTSVQFKLDGNNLGPADTTSPYSISWDTTTASNGSHTLTAVATDTNGQTTTLAARTVTVNNTVSNPPPTVALTAPTDGSTVSGTVSVSADASDDTGVTSVQFKLDGNNLGPADTTSPYSISWDTTTASNGSRTLTAVATDTNGQTTTLAARTVTVSNTVANPPPTVALTAPTDGSTNPGTVSVSADASDDTGVTSVQFKLDGNNLGPADTTSPCSISWDTTTASNGSHTLTAVATDSNGQTTTSTARTVTVSNAGAGQSGLVLAFGFSQTGLSVVDQSGSGNNGVVSGATSVTTGHTGRGRRFDGTNDLVRVTDSASLDLTGPLTIEAWVFPTALGAKLRPIVVKQVTGSTIAYGLHAHRTNPRRPAGIVVANGATRTVNGTTVMPSSTWTHLAFTFDGTNLRLYVNGSLVQTVAATGAIAATTGDLLIGTDTVGWFKGTLDDLRIYNRALTATEIATDLTTPVP